jgi:hypothetical protein
MDEIQVGKTAGLLIDSRAGRTMDQAELDGYATAMCRIS